MLMDRLNIRGQKILDVFEGFLVLLKDQGKDDRHCHEQHTIRHARKLGLNPAIPQLRGNKSRGTV